MREDILDYVKTLSLGTYTVSDELPREESGVPLYLKNPKRIYADQEQFVQEPIVTAMDGFDIHQEATTVSLYFTSDAKTLPANYNTLVSNLKLGKNIVPADGYNTRAVDVQTEYEADLLVTRVDFTFSKLT